MKSSILILAVMFLATGFLAADVSAEAGGINDGYVGCSYSETCVPFNLDTCATGTPINLLPEGDYCYDATMNPAGTEIWIPGASGDGLIVIDRATNTVSHHIPVADYVISAAFCNDGNHALVSSRNDKTISQISTATYTVTGVLQLGSQPGNMALDPVSGLIYAVEWYGGLLYEISADGSVALDSTSIGNSLWQLVISPDGAYIYATDRGTDQVRIIDRETMTQVHAVGVGDDPWGIDVTLDGSKLVVACEDSHDAYVIATGTWDVTQISLGTNSDPRDVDILDASQRAFIPGGDTGTTDFVFVLDLTIDELEGSFTIPGSNTNVIAVQPQVSSGGSGIPDGGVWPPLSVSLSNHPNPFSRETLIQYRLDESTPVDLAVFDPTGRRLITLEQGLATAGEHGLLWNGRDNLGNAAGQGIYFIRLQAGLGTRIVKAVQLR
ncbi:MAG: T9SS type A sorting domain-containing protein [Candidatus Eisenbacteria sp.]|nr:T9SS type A sorting domain-containing protein [Candidatus Eisenbacteria bacterium]